MKKPDFNVEMLINFSNKQKAVIIGAGVVLSLALIGGGVHASNQNKYAEEMQKQIETAKAEQVEYTVGNDVAGFDFNSVPYIQMGYSNLDDYWNDIQVLRLQAEGIADSAINSYGAYMSDEQKEQLRRYEKTMVNAVCFEDFDEAMDNFNAIVAECRPVYSYSGGYSGGDPYNFKRDGVVYSNGTRFTWYSSNVLYHYRTGEWTAGSDGFYRDDNGYIIVASSDHSQGTIVDTPWGQGIVADSGCASGTLDIYCNY